MMLGLEAAVVGTGQNASAETTARNVHEINPITGSTWKRKGLLQRKNRPELVFRTVD